MDPELAQLISFRALERAQHTIEDFVQTYFPLHGLDPLKDFLAWWHLLVFVEGAIYQADEENEAAASTGSGGDGAEPGSACLDAVASVLRSRGLLTPGVQQELDAGRRYWAAERRLCGLMGRAPCVPPGGHAASCGFALEEALTASALKSFDYRLLHHLVYALRRVPPDPALLAFLRVDEQLVDLGDDLLDYEDDITAGDGGAGGSGAGGSGAGGSGAGDITAGGSGAGGSGNGSGGGGGGGGSSEEGGTTGSSGAGSAGGSFNLLRCYVHLFGQEAPLQLVQRIGRLEAQRDELLAALTEEQQQHVRRRQVEAADEGEGALRWQIPAIVLDEAAFRRQFAD